MMMGRRRRPGERHLAASAVDCQPRRATTLGRRLRNLEPLMGDRDGGHLAAPPLPHHRANGSNRRFDWVMLRVEVAPLFLSVRRAVMAAMDGPSIRGGVGGASLRRRRGRDALRSGGGRRRLGLARGGRGADGLDEEKRRVPVQARLIAFEGEHVIGAPVDDALGDLLLRSHRVDRDECGLEAEHVQELRNRRDLVGHPHDAALRQHHPGLGGVSRNQCSAPDIFEPRGPNRSLARTKVVGSYPECRP
jgi:hypothetical protein